MENFHKYTKIKIVGHEDNKDIFSNPEDEIVLQEKMDGANFRFMITKEGNIIFGSRTQQLTSDKGEDTNLEKNFRRCAEFVRDSIKKNEPVPENIKHLIFYGECMVRHTMAYDWENIPTYLGFDIYDLRTGKYLDYNVIKVIFEQLGLEMVPFLGEFPAKHFKKIDDGFVPKTLYPSLSSKDRQAEGVVFKNYSKQIFAKYVREKFKEKNKEVFGTSKKFAKTDDDYFLAVYCTNARIDKCIFKLIDFGKKLDMTMMGDLVKLVYKDIWEENWQEISTSKKKIDLLNLKKLVSKRCLEVLKQAIVNNSLK
jgi:hypothetical protein